MSGLPDWAQDSRVLVEVKPEAQVHTLFELADLLCTRVRLVQQSATRWTLSLMGVEVKDGVVLVSLYGDGVTPDAARENYCQKIENSLLVINATNPQTRFELRVGKVQL